MNIKNKIKEIWNKFLRFFINRDYLGARFLNAANYNVIYDVENSRIYQNVLGKKCYIAHPKHGIPNYKKINTIEWVCSEIYYKYYIPGDDETVVDIGTGYGHEILWLRSFSNAKIICVEPNPEVYAYLRFNTSTFKNIILENAFIGSMKQAVLSFSTDYASTGSSGVDNGVLVDGRTFDEITRGEKNIALVKINIEGGETDFIDNTNLSKIDRLVISCHDFRANRGDGEFFRTFDYVSNKLTNLGYNIKLFNPELSPSAAWAEGVKYWIFATRI